MPIAKRYIPEIVVPGKPVGRHVHHDPRARLFVAKMAPAYGDVLHVMRGGLPLDQTRGSCTAEALCGYRNCDPDFGGRGVFTQKMADWLYDREIEAEGGNPKTDDPGGSGPTVCKVAQKQGWIKSYGHTFSFEDALKALMLRPELWGVNWYDSCDTPDSKGVARITKGAQVRGGHEIVAVGIMLAEQLVCFWQSWGIGYGVAPPAGAVAGSSPAGGFFYMTFGDLERLLSEQGDVTTPNGI